jgi:sporulation protein YhbH
VYGKNTKGVGTGNGEEKRGDIFSGEKEGHSGKGQAGNEDGEDIYETEITIEELINYLFDDLELPDLDKKRLANVETISERRNSGYQRKGIPPRLAKKRSVIEKVKRKQSMKRDERNLYEDAGCSGKDNCAADTSSGLNENQRFPFKEDDLRYHKIREDRKRDYNAVVICIMDVSGSMDQTKKYIARSFYFLLYQFLTLRYANVEIVFVAHTTTAKEVNESEFSHRGESGGTYISSGYEKALEIIEQRYNPSNWNIYAFHCSDGDNWSEDNQKAIDLASKLCDVCNMFGYCEIVPGYFSVGSTIKSEYQKHVKGRNFGIITMGKKEDILPGLKKLLEKECL